MKKLLLASMLGMFWLGSATEPCGYDFKQAHEIGLPLTYCFARQVRGHETFNGFLGLPCEGSACSAVNHL